jgi:hypothetical protein
MLFNTGEKKLRNYFVSIFSIDITDSNLSFQWYSLAEMVGIKSSGRGSYIIKYFFYIVWGCLFAFTAAMFVRVFAPYACGSGIPNVRWFKIYELCYLQS